MKKLIFASAATMIASVASAGLYGDTPDATHAWAVHDRNRPNPVKIVAEPGLPPSDAIILFDGTEKTFANWCSMKMEPTKWKLVNGTLESVKGAGYIRTKAEYGPNFQLHVEWATPVKVEGVEPLRQRRHRLRRGGPVQIQHGHACHRLASDRGFHQLELRRAEPAPHKGGVYPQGLDEGILGALDGLLKCRLRHGALYIGSGLKAHRLTGSVKQQHTAAVGEVVYHLIHGPPVLRRAVVDRPGQDAQEALALAFALRQAHKTRERPDHILREHTGRDETVQPADGYNMV